MANYYIDPTGDGGVGSLGDPDVAFPATPVSNTEYDIKAGTSLNVGSGKLFSAKSNIIISDYGTGAKPVITGTAGANIRLTSASNNDHFTVSDVVIDGSASTQTLVYINSTGIGHYFDNVDFVGNADPSTTAPLVNFGQNKLETLSVSSCTFTNHDRTITWLYTGAGTVTSTGVLIDGCTFTNTYGDPIKLTVEAPTRETSTINNITISNNKFDTCAGFAMVRNGYALEDARIWGTGIVVSDNVFINSANNPYIASGQGASVSLTGTDGAIISGNYLYNCWSQGALIQTGDNKNLIIENNYCEHSVTNAFNDADGLGIFDDRINTGSIVRYNTVVDCPGYGRVNPAPADNYGGGIGFWKANNARHYCNVVKDSAKGWTYGSVEEHGNKVYNNTLIDNATAGLYRYGSAALAGALLFKNNLIIGSAAVQAGGTASSTLTTNLSYATTALAGLVVDGVGLPIGLAPGSPCIGAGTDLDQYTVSKNGYPYYSPPSVGAHEVPRIFDMFSAGWMG